MALRMVRLDTTATGYTARKTIPRGVAEDYQKLFGKSHEEWFTAPKNLPPHEAKRRFATWLSEVEARIAAIRNRRRGEGQSLTHEQAHGLAGQWYQWFIARGDGVSLDALTERLQIVWGPEWAEAGQDFDRVMEDTAVRADIRAMIAVQANVEKFLAEKGVALTLAAYTLFLDALIPLYLEAFGLLQRRAKGDYSPDELPKTFPKFTRSKIGPWQLFERWIKEAKPALSTVNRWRGTFLALQEHFKNKELNEENVREWARGLVTANRSAYTVATNWLSAARTVYSWAKEQRLVASNPFKEVRVKIPAKTLHRETLAFTSDEARTILLAASAIKPKSTFQFAQRWCPWLAAYSGSRMGELTQLRGQDIEQRGDHWVMKLTPDAGPIKSKKTRVVPLHEHIIAQGFLEFVSQRGKGALFYNVDKGNGDDDPTNPRRPRSVKVRERLGQWIRTIGVKDGELQPNHAWRHTFKQSAARADMREQIVDAICGHAPASIGRSYGQPTVEDLVREMKRFPRYEW